PCGCCLCWSTLAPPTHSYSLSPTRRSSDLRQEILVRLMGVQKQEIGNGGPGGRPMPPRPGPGPGPRPAPAGGSAAAAFYKAKARSEEHTSELQSRENLVCRLLLEKKNQAPDLSDNVSAPELKLQSQREPLPDLASQLYARDHHKCTGGPRLRTNLDTAHHADFASL